MLIQITNFFSDNSNFFHRLPFKFVHGLVCCICKNQDCRRISAAFYTPFVLFSQLSAIAVKDAFGVKAANQKTAPAGGIFQACESIFVIPFN